MTDLHQRIAALSPSQRALLELSDSGEASWTTVEASGFLALQRSTAARLDEPSGWGDLPFELFAPTLKSMAATAKLGWDPYLHDPKLRKRLHRVTAPTLVVHGEQDAFVARAHSEAYADGIPGARIVDLPGGHLLSLEQPERLAATVRDFVAP